MGIMTALIIPMRLAAPMEQTIARKQSISVIQESVSIRAGCVMERTIARMGRMKDSAVSIQGCLSGFKLKKHLDENTPIFKSLNNSSI